MTAETIAYSSFHTISRPACSGDHSDLSQWFDQNASQPLLPEVSVNNCIAELRVHLELRFLTMRGENQTTTKGLGMPHLSCEWDGEVWTLNN